MADSAPKSDQPSSSSSSSEVSVALEKGSTSENGGHGHSNGGGDEEVVRSESVGGPTSNGAAIDSSGTHGTEILKANTKPSEISSPDKSKPPSGNPKLGRSKTERQKHNICAEEAAKIFDNKIPVQKKLQLLTRIATVKDDGTVEFEIPGDIRVIGDESENVNTDVEDESLDATELQYIPPMQIVMLIVGTRGDVQPFIAIGKRLQDYGHRVRLATHANFKEFVLTAGLEFYPLGGDPKVLAGYMVKNKGFLPSGPSEIPAQRNQMKDIIYSLLPACKEPDMDTGVAFNAEAIIANPPAYGHTHVAEALKIPIHIFFTMPWT
nr:Sterol 3-beta-glucosyltransferase UGT80A2 [Ipomoea batatas]